MPFTQLSLSHKRTDLNIAHDTRGITNIDKVRRRKNKTAESKS